MTDKEIDRLTKLKEIDNTFFDMGMNYICGIDEAGRGPLAGPVAVASVILPKDSMIEGVNDSKKISEKKREKIYEEIISNAISYNVRTNRRNSNRRYKYFTSNKITDLLIP